MEAELDANQRPEPNTIDRRRLILAGGATLLAISSLPRRSFAQQPSVVNVGFSYSSPLMVLV